MINYEVLFILPGTLVVDEIAPLVKKVKIEVEANGGVDLSIKELGKKRLAYPIKHIRYGYFQLAYFQAEPEAVKNIKKKISLLPEFLRVLVKKYNSNSTAEKKINFTLPKFNSTNNLVSREKNNREKNKNISKTNRNEIEKTQEELEKRPTTREEAEGITVMKIEEVEDKKVKTKKSKKKVKLDDIDKKLDDILNIDLDSV